MKFQFDDGFDSLREAIDAVTDLFDSQEVCQTNFTVASLSGSPPMSLKLGQPSGDLGVGKPPAPYSKHLLHIARLS